MILERGLWIELGLNLELSEHIIEVDGEPFKGSTEPMVDLVLYIFNDLNIEILHLKKFLPMLISKKYTSQNMYVLLQKDYV